MRKKSDMRYPTLAVATVALIMGASFAYGGSMNEVAPRDTSFERVSRAYAAMDERYVRRGIPRTPAQLSGLATGQSANEIVAILGDPIATERSGAWHFNVNLPLTNDDELVCQYKVVFDQGVVERGIWRRPQCANIAAQAGSR